MIALSASLVLYNNPVDQFAEAIRCYLVGSEGRLVVVDNSPVEIRHHYFSHPRVDYIFAGENLGFGRGHNRALTVIGDSSDAHLILNPDIAFGPEVLPYLVQYLENHPAAGAVMPRIEYFDGSQQRLTKLLPTPVDLVLRRFIPVSSIQKAINRRYELHALPQDVPTTVPSLSGCFLLTRTKVLQDLGGFDERYFMYMEDVDLVRRIGDSWETVYVPQVSVSHGYEKSSYTNPVLRRAHIRSALRYFHKWGWFIDLQRRTRNRRMLSVVDRSRCGAISEAESS